MQIVKTRHIEDCFDGSRVQDLLLDGPLTDVEIRRLGALGELQRFDCFPRVLFVVNDPQRFKIKGIAGNTSLRVIIYGSDVARSVGAVAACLAPTGPGPPRQDLTFVTSAT